MDGMSEKATAILDYLVAGGVIECGKLEGLPTAERDSVNAQRSRWKGYVVHPLDCLHMGRYNGYGSRL